MLVCKFLSLYSSDPWQLYFDLFFFTTLFKSLKRLSEKYYFRIIEFLTFWVADEQMTPLIETHKIEYNRYLKQILGKPLIHQEPELYMESRAVNQSASTLFLPIEE